MTRIEKMIETADEMEVDGIRWVRLFDTRTPRYACRGFGHVRVEQSERTGEWLVTRIGIVKKAELVDAQSAMTWAIDLIRETAEERVGKAKTRLTEAREAARAVGVVVK
jgi:hypothetical protein